MKKKKSGFIHDIIRNPLSYLMALPALLFILVFNYLTLPYLVIAFKRIDYSKGIWASDWVGFKNFEFFFKSKDAWNVTFNTLKLNALFIVFGTVAAVLIALAFNELRRKHFKKVTQSLMLFPNFLSWVVVGLILYALLSSESGFINTILADLGFNKINFYAEAQKWPIILVILKVWKDAGMSSIIYLAAMTGIDAEIYEAASIDGASRGKQLIYLTIPLIMPTVAIMTLLAIGRIFYGDFGMLYPIIGDNGMLLPTTDVIDTYVFRALRKIGDPSIATAIGLYQSIVGFILVYASNKIVKKISPESSLF